MTLGAVFEPATRAARLIPAALAVTLVALLPGTAAAQMSASELETLVAPIALYPDPLLAQVFPAATYPDQVAEAAAYVAANGTSGIDSQGWDPSVAAVARYTEAIQLLGSDPTWTAELGTAFLDQTSGVMDAVQQMRSRARASGALQNSPQQNVVVKEEVVTIVPAEPDVIYVPTYDPAVVYAAPTVVEVDYDDDVDWDDAVVAGAIGFGAGVAMGAWLDMDCDWWGHSMYYHGWGGGGSYWHSGNYANFNRNTNINVDNSRNNIWNNPNRPGGSGNRNRASQLPADRRNNRQGDRDTRQGDRQDRRGDRASQQPADRRDARQGDRQDRRGDRPSQQPADARGDRRDAGAGNRANAGAGDRRPGAEARPGGGTGADRARPSQRPSDDLARKRENAQRQMRGKMDSPGGGRGDAVPEMRGQGSRPGNTAKGGSAQRPGQASRPSADRSRPDANRAQRGGFDSYQRGSDARRASERGAASRQNSSFDRGGRSAGGGRSVGGGGRSSAPKVSRPSGGRGGGGGRPSGGGGGGRRGGGRRG